MAVAERDGDAAENVLRAAATASVAAASAHAAAASTEASANELAIAKTDAKRAADDAATTSTNALPEGVRAVDPTQQALPDLEQLRGLARAREAKNLDTAAKALAGITTLITGFFTAFGLDSGDFERMFRDFFWQSFAFLVAAAAALLLGTFAFVINASRSETNLWFERAAVYIGIGLSGSALVLGSWGLSQGDSAGPTRPVLSATIDASGKSPVPTLPVWC